jgi:hypothetical protein
LVSLGFFPSLEAF